MNIEKKYNSVVDCSYNGEDGSIHEGIKTYKTLGSAVRNADTSDKQQYTIFVKPGRYYEQVVIDKPYIKLIAEDCKNTILTYDAAHGMLREDGSKYGTTGSASITVTGSDFSAENITFENGFDYPKNEYKVSNDPSRISGSQAVAFKTAQGNDRASFVNCRFLGFQDTLYIDSGTHYFKNCYIEGNIDFIFGAGQAYFEDCIIASIGKAGSENNGYITAPSTMISQKFGFIFNNCNIIKANNETADYTVTLGRPWHPTTNFSDGTRCANPDTVGSAVFINCSMDSHIKPQGWDKMSGKDKDGNTIWFYPDNIQHSRFFEYRSTGHGAVSVPSLDRKFLSQQEADKYLQYGINVKEGCKNSI